MGNKRRRHTEEFKAKVALDALRGIRTLSELSSVYKVHPTVIAQWKRQLIAGAAAAFQTGHGRGPKTEEELTAPLFEEIGRLKMELNWLKKKCSV
jgi:putative transposase